MTIEWPTFERCTGLAGTRDFLRGCWRQNGQIPHQGAPESAEHLRVRDEENLWVVRSLTPQSHQSDADPTRTGFISTMGFPSIASSGDCQNWNTTQFHRVGVVRWPCREHDGYWKSRWIRIGCRNWWIREARDWRLRLRHMILVTGTGDKTGGVPISAI